MRPTSHVPILLPLALFVLACAPPPPADAAFLGGSQGLVDIGTPTVVNPDLSLNTLFQFGSIITTNFEAGSFAATPTPLVLLGSSTLDVTNITAFAFGSAAFGTFAATSYSDVIISLADRQLMVVGTFTAGTIFGAGVAAAPADLLIDFNRGANGTIYFGGLLDVAAPTAAPTASVPEPASVALLGLGLLGAVGASARRWRRR